MKEWKLLKQTGTDHFAQFLEEWKHDPRRKELIHPPARIFSLDPNHSHLQNCKEWKSHISIIGPWCETNFNCLQYSISFILILSLIVSYIRRKMSKCLDSPSCPASRQHPHRDQPLSQCQSLEAQLTRKTRNTLGKKLGKQMRKVRISMQCK